MKAEHIQEAIAIIAKSNQPKVSFRVPVSDSFSRIHEILIHESNASLISELRDAGFDLYMCEKGLSVNKYKS
jgi:hypothetical protein